MTVDDSSSGQSALVIQPGAAARVKSVDVLRGIAVLGILVANITAFSTPAMLSQSPRFTEGMAAFDQTLVLLRELFVSGKFRSMLCVMFGVGLYMQFVKRVNIPKAWPNSYQARMVLLFALGLFHGLFIWYGDILHVYAIGAIVTSVFVKQSDKFLAGAIAILLAIGLPVGLLLAVVSNMPGGQEQMMAGVPFMELLTIAQEQRIYSSGNWGEQLIHRLVLITVGFGNLVIILPTVIALFFTGILLTRRGFLKPETRDPNDVKWVLGVGLGIGGLLTLIPLVFHLFNLKGSTSIFTEVASAPLVGIGYFGLAAILIPKLPGLLTATFERIGKVALSVYISQSIICVCIFYSWGGDLYGKLAFSQQLLVCLGVWVVNIVFAWVWTSKFSIGPLEWLWRSAEARRPLPWKTQVVAGPPPATTVNSEVS